MWFVLQTSLRKRSSSLSKHNFLMILLQNTTKNKNLRQPTYCVVFDSIPISLNGCFSRDIKEKNYRQNTRKTRKSPKLTHRNSQNGVLYVGESITTQYIITDRSREFLIDSPKRGLFLFNGRINVSTKINTTTSSVR